MTDPQPNMRKTRFVCVSDTHNSMPGGAFRLPKGDVLLHAGDMTNQGSYSELQKTIKWLEDADFEAKIVIAGNHDITLDSDFYEQNGHQFHNQNPQDPSKCQALFENSPSILYLKHGSAVINLQSPNGPRTSFKIFGSPYSPARGKWAFGYGSDIAAHIWDGIPLDADIVMTHTPPMHHCDKAKGGQAAGCPALREALWRTRPRLAICGHVHEGRGVERVRWDIEAPDATSEAESITKWEDPGRYGKSISLVDLTTRDDHAIQNNGSLCHHNNVDADISNIPKETCIVNAAIIASSWPHGPGGKKFNKPIVVDIDLPLWDK